MIDIKTAVQPTVYCRFREMNTITIYTVEFSFIHKVIAIVLQ
jgi:hypothetical protein